MFSKKGSILVITMGFALVFTLFGVSAIYLSSLQSEAQEKMILGSQAFWLAEGGTAHALSALKSKIRLDLKGAIFNSPPSSVSSYMAGYFARQDALGLLSRYGQFTVSGNTATLQINPSQSLELWTGDQVGTSVPRGSYQGSYLATLTVRPQGPQPVTHPGSSAAEIYVFTYTYSITSTGSIVNNPIQKTVNLSSGNFSITVQRDNYARYALFTNHNNTSSGETVWFTANTNFSGPLYTNERFSFANNPSGHFTGTVTQVYDTARFYNNGSPVLIDADRNRNRDVPIFDQGFQRGYNPITLPSSITQQNLKSEALGGISEPTTNGVYVPNNGNQVTGGIYVRGDASLVMSVGTNSRPVYTITQGSKTTTITVNYQANTTTVGSKTYSGIPDGMSQSGGALIYAKNNITSFSGTVQKDSLVTVSSESDIVITNNIQYEKDPRVSGNENYNNLLGIISWVGDVRIGTSAPNNINVHGVVMAPQGEFTVDNYDHGSPRGVATLLGGTITDHYGAFGTFSGSGQESGYARNFVYDTRMQNGLIPLYFPYISNFIADDKGSLNNPLTWQEG
jgi:hypothetical protein